MRILITGICGFAGSALAESLLERVEGVNICGIDNLMRPGSESNRGRLRRLGVEFVHGDIRATSDWAQLPACDWVIDAAAHASVLAGVSGQATSRQLFEHNLGAIGNVLEYAKQHVAGLLLLSSSRVYSIPALAALPLRAEGKRFQLDDARGLPAGVSARGITADFSTAPPVSLYGATKLAAETMALEYGQAFGFPVWITRCGVLAGAGQFGTPDQGIFSYWINAHLRRRALRFIGFGGEGLQVRDAFHPRDLAVLLLAQMQCTDAAAPRVMTAGGGAENAMSLAELHAWCDQRFGARAAGSDDAPRPYDIPWMVMDSTRAEEAFGWRPATGIAALLEEIACHAEGHPEWLEWSGL